MKVAFLGRTQVLLDTIELFERSEHKIVGIGTCRAAEEYSAKESDFKEKAEKLGVPFFCNSQINSQNIQKIIADMQADIAISVNWLTIIKENTLKIFPYGILNGHAGDLPRYRGNACPNWAIINGEERIGLTVHFMEANHLDSGDIVKKEFIDINNKTTIGELYNVMDNLLPQMFLQAVGEIEEHGKNVSLPQSRKREDILRCFPRIPSDSCIDWNRSCVEIDRLIRASGYPFRGAYTFINGMKKIYIMEAAISEYEFPSVVICGQVVFRDCEKDTVSIAANDGVITIYKICDESQKPCKVTDEIKSMRDRMGMCVQDRIYELMKEIEELKSCVYTGLRGEK